MPAFVLGHESGGSWRLWVIDYVDYVDDVLCAHT